MSRGRPQGSAPGASPPTAPPRPEGAASRGPVRREVLGVLLLALAAVTILGLSRISSGAVLGWWALVVRRAFGWGAYPVVLGVGFLGLRLAWQDLGRWLSASPATWVGLELLLLVLLTASHAPHVLRAAGDEAFVAAQQGRGGGLVGWALATPLIGGLGRFAGSLLLFAAGVVAIGLLLSGSERTLWDRLRRGGRWIVARLERLRAARQEAPVSPAPAEAPWWEREPEAVEQAAPRRRQPKPPRAGKAARRRSHDTSLPPLDLLDPASPQAYGEADVRRKTEIIEDTLASFGIPARVVEVRQGPTVTQFGLDPGFIERRAPDGQILRQRVRVARIAGLVDDLALALAAAPLRIETPVPGRSVVGLEVPNQQTALVSLRQVMESAEFHALDSRLALALGEDVAGRPVSVDLALMPHLLIAGATGSGKSVCINAIVCCLLFHNSPDDLKMLMIDPKMVELIGYNGIPHLIAPVIVDVEQVVGALAWVSRQMDERYRLLHAAGVRNLGQYNLKVSRRKDGATLPVLLVFVDELADLMMMAPDEVERHICRLAQMGRATGIHLVIATQRPSVDVVTGQIKANFPARISFAVTSQVDSRVILDHNGAESLLGRGDGLLVVPQQAGSVRVQGCYVSDAELERLTGFWRARGDDEVDAAVPWAGVEPEADDGLLDRALEVARGRDRISTSFMQRQLRIGFPRAARLMDQLEEQGIVGPDEGAGRGRKVLLDEGIDLDRIAERLPGEEPD